MRLDQRATAPALAVAAVSMALFALGGWLWWVVSGLGDTRAVFAKSVLIGALCSFALWLAWLLVAYAALQRLAGVSVRVDRLLRTAGFATLPLAAGLLMVVPFVSFGVGLAVIGLWLLTMQVAIELAAEVPRRPAVLANLAGFAVWAVVLSLLATGDQPIAPGVFLAEAIFDAVSDLEGAIG